MRIDTDLHERDVPGVMDWLGAQIGGTLKKRVENLEYRERENPLFAWYSQQAFALEFALEEARRIRRRRSHFPRNEPFETAYGIAAAMQRVHAQLNAFGKGQFAGRLQGAMKEQSGLRPISYEVLILTHLAHRGFDVECIDLTGRGRYDFLATRSGESIEVECKTTARDVGRKIHMSEVSTLGNVLWPIARPLLDKGGFHLLLIEVPNRLSAREEDMRGLADLFARAVVDDGHADGEMATVEYTVIDTQPKGLPDTMEDKLRSIFLSEFGRQASSIVFYGRPEGGALAIGVRSREPDKVLDALADQAKEAAKQCTGERPAVIAMQMTEISRAQLTDLVKGPSGLHKIVHEVLRAEDRRHVESIAFTVPPVLRRTPLIGVTEISGLVGVIHNPAPKHPSDTARRLFEAPSD
jgi:hypothetical protein